MASSKLPSLKRFVLQTLSFSIRLIQYNTMGGAFTHFSQSHHEDFVSVSCPTVEHLPLSEKKNNQMPRGEWRMDEIGIVRAIESNMYSETSMKRTPY